MPTFPDDYAAIRAIKARLELVFSTTYAAKYVRYNGVDVELKTDEDSEPENIGKPLILLDQSSGDRSDWSSAQGEVRQVAVLATTFVSDGSGGTHGAANPTTSDEFLSKDMVAEFESNRAAWDMVGIHDPSIRSDGLDKREGDTVRRIRHTITFQYFRA